MNQRSRMKYGLGLIEAMLTDAVAEGAIPDQLVRSTAHVLLGIAGRGQRR